MDTIQEQLRELQAIRQMLEEHHRWVREAQQSQVRRLRRSQTIGLIGMGMALAILAWYFATTFRIWQVLQAHS